MIHIEDLCTEDVFSTEPCVLKVDDDSSNQYKVYRLFTGQVKLSCEDTSRECEVVNNAMASHYGVCDGNFAQTIASYIINEDDVDGVSWMGDNIQNVKLKQKNTKYFQELYNEVCSYHFAVSYNNYIQAFVHEYRMIEYIAYAYPLIYAIRSHDFYLTFGHLKKFIENEGKGELGFFKQAINKIFEGNDIFNTSFDITLDSITNPNIRDNYNSILKSCIKEEWLHISTTDNLFALKFNCVGSVLIELRNKIFHHSVNTTNNILASKLQDMNFFMELITPTFYTWLGVVYTEIFKAILDFEQS